MERGVKACGGMEVFGELLLNRLLSNLTADAIPRFRQLLARPYVVLFVETGDAECLSASHVLDRFCRFHNSGVKCGRTAARMVDACTRLALFVAVFASCPLIDASLGVFRLAICPSATLAVVSAATAHYLAADAPWMALICFLAAHLLPR